MRTASKEFKVKCPTCQKQVQWKDNPFRPFCGERCSLIDMGKWADDQYKIESEDQHVDETDEPKG
ncbi:MAG: DNA gyrase inhibitor YacG [Deltaproteobacteria bacterium]|nr:DNA gyrase inhibitor YacG [Deltaproteobacteria bacterium]